MPDPVVLLDRGEAAMRLHVSERTVRRWGKAVSSGAASGGFNICDAQPPRSIPLRGRRGD